MRNFIDIITNVPAEVVLNESAMTLDDAKKILSDEHISVSEIKGAKIELKPWNDGGYVLIADDEDVAEFTSKALADKVAAAARMVCKESVEANVEENAKPSLQSYYDKAVSLHEGLHGSTISDIDVQGFIQGYVACLLWSSTDNHGVELDKNFSEADLSPEAHDRIEADCRSFLHTAAPFLTADRYKGAKLGTLESHAGHDFWLTRVGHGSGFWDGDWEGEESGTDGPLTKAARAFGNIDPYVGDDGKIHLA